MSVIVLANASSLEQNQGGYFWLVFVSDVALDPFVTSFTGFGTHNLELLLWDQICNGKTVTYAMELLFSVLAQLATTYK